MKHISRIMPLVSIGLRILTEKQAKDMGLKYARDLKELKGELSKIYHIYIDDNGNEYLVKKNNAL